MSRTMSLMAIAIVLVVCVGTVLTPWGQRGLDVLTQWAFALQRQLNRSLANGMMAVDTLSPPQIMLLLGVSFSYGLLHAVGPGHGKVVITTFLLTQRAQLRQGIIMTLCAALLQGITAIVLVGTLGGLLGWLTQDIAQDIVPWIEAASGVGIIGLGVIMLWRSITATTAHHAHHGKGCHCHGHAIAADAERKMRWGAIASIGLRPCSGAVVLLGVTLLMGHVGWGMLAVMVMALGTAIMTSALAILSVLMRQLAIRISHTRPSRYWHWLRQGVVLVGGCGLILFGSVLLCHDAGLSTVWKSSGDPAAPTAHPFMPRSPATLE